MYLGSFGIDDYVGIPAATHRFTTGGVYAPTVLTYSIYEEATDVGIDENVDMVVVSPFDSVVGCYWVRRQLTTAAGFEAGKNYMVLVKATVDSVSAIQMHTFQVAAKVNTVYAGGSTVASGAIPNAAAGANGGLPTTNGTKINQTVDLTGGQSIAASSVPAVTLANGAHGGAATVITLQTPIAATVPNTQKVDVETIKTQAVTCAAGVTVLASVGTAAASTAQTGDVAALITTVGVAGAGLIALGDARIGNLDATVSSRLAPAGTLALCTLTTTTSTLTNAPPDSSGVTTLLARIGAFTGTGWNTLLGFLRALMRKDVGVTLPTDIGGTFDNTTDSVEAIRDTAPLGSAMRGTDSAALAATALDNTVWTNAKAAFLNENISAAKTLTSAYDAAKTAAQAGNQMDLVNAPNATALNAAADAHLDRANAIETGVTPRQAHRLEVAAAAGVTSGMATATPLVKNPAGTKTRVTATADVDGNRTAITLTDLT